MQRATPAREATPLRAFEFVGAPAILESLNGADAYSAAMAFIRGEIEIAGDLMEAARYYLGREGSGIKAHVMRAVLKATPWRLQQLLQSRETAAGNIRFHYDRSDDFFRQFLDRHMVYSCAYFRDPKHSLDDAQEAKLEHICRKLMLEPTDRFLDIGCGWGALVMHAVRHFGARAEGCTLSRNQAEHAKNMMREASVENRVAIHDVDYRDVKGPFDKIASVGMFEHVGAARLREYFAKVYELLAPEGLFLNHGITRPRGVASGTDGLFIARHVFPGGEIVGLADVIRAAELVGFEILDVENLRRHYALTCRAWVDRLKAKKDACLKTVDEQTWRIWQLYLAGSAVAFEDGNLGLHQVLMAKRGKGSRLPMSREYMYRSN